MITERVSNVRVKNGLKELALRSHGVKVRVVASYASKRLWACRKYASKSKLKINFSLLINNMIKTINNLLANFHII